MNIFLVDILTLIGIFSKYLLDLGRKVLFLKSNRNTIKFNAIKNFIFIENNKICLNNKILMSYRK
jgi:hypothetical protein